MEQRIYIRACLVVVQDDRILLVPHFDTDVAPLQYNMPGGGVEFGETVEAAALRELTEETGLIARSEGLFDLYEHHLPDYHSITIAYRGVITGGEMLAEDTRRGKREPRWFTKADLSTVKYHPLPLINKAMGIE